MRAAPLIFNLFPRYFETIRQWAGILPHVARMGFSHVYVNPFTATGFSGSLYAVKDYYLLNPYFLTAGQDQSDWSPVRDFAAACGQYGMRLMADLVINHTAIDAPLVKTHPGWFLRDDCGKVVSPFAVDPADSSKKTVWGDLAKINHRGTPDRQGLWNFFDRLVSFYQKTGIRCFRCDAAYQVPADLWRYLIASAKNRFPDTVFFAETLGCRPDQVLELKGTGFDYLFNSSKWWQFDSAWCTDQHEENRTVAPSVSFPESHDTERLARECHGTVAVQKSRYVFAAVFSEGLLMTMGYERGAKKRMDVVRGAPRDLDEQSPWDLTDWIAAVNGMKGSQPVLSEEGRWRVLSPFDRQILVLEKHSLSGNDPVLIAINKNRNHREPLSGGPDIIEALKRYCALIRPCSSPGGSTTLPDTVSMEPAEIIVCTTG